MNSKRGFFLTLEGVEGAGKSTSSIFIQNYLNEIGRAFTITREPGGTVYGEQIRTLLLAPEHSDLCIETEILLMFAARAQHIQQIIRPALKLGHVVLCDRFTDATYAYQGGGRGIADTRIHILEKWVQDDLYPDLTLLFDVPVELGLQRAKNRSALDRFEQEKIQFFERVRTKYLAIAKHEPRRVRIIDGSLSPAQVGSQVQTVLHEVFP